MIRELRDRLSSEGGFTLVEMLVTMMIGTVVFGAALGLTEVSQRSTRRTTDRVEVAQRARLAMERMVRQLRSQVCLNSTTYPIVSADDNSITFYVDYDNNPVYKPQKRRISFDSSGSGKLLEEQFDATTTTAPWSFASIASRSFTILTNVGRIGTTPIFRYFNPAGTQLSTPLSTTATSPIPANSIARASVIEVAFEALPSSGDQDATRRADRDTRVTVRTQTADSGDADPNRLVCG